MKRIIICNILIVFILFSSACGDNFTPDVDVVHSWELVSAKEESSSYLDQDNNYESEDRVVSAEIDEVNSESVVSDTSEKEESSIKLPDGIDIGDCGTYSLKDENGLDIEVDCVFTKVISGSISDEYISALVNDYNLITPPEENMDLDNDSTYVTVAMEFELFSGRELEGVFPSYYQVPYPAEISLNSTSGSIEYEMGIYDRDYEHHSYGEKIKGWVIFKIDGDVDLYSCYVTLSNGGNESLDYKIKRY